MQKLHGQFQTELHQAIDRYVKDHSFRARSEHRRKDVAQLHAIIDQTELDDDQLVHELLSYFASEDYYTGTLDRSQLEDNIIRCILKHDDALKTAFEAFGPTELADIELIPSQPAPIDNKETISYSFNDYIQFAIDKYTEEKSGTRPPHRDRSEKYIQEILHNATLNEDQKIKKIKDYFDGTDVYAPPFEKPFRSSFRQYVLEGIKYYNLYKDTPIRQVQTRTWPVNEPEKIMIFLHGWRDSLETATPMARLAQQAGYEVIAYDHRGHGNDDERHHPRIPSTTGALFRLDFQKFLAKVQEKYPGKPIALVGHSLGGSMLAAEHAHIHKIPAVKNVTLLAPAITSNIINLARPDRKLHRMAHPELKKWYHTTNRIPGKTGAKTFHILPNLLVFMRQAFHALKRLFQAKTKLTVPWRIFAGKQDYYLIHQQVGNLKAEYGEHKNLQTTFFRHEDHTFPLSRHHQVVLPRILTEIEKDFIPTLPAPAEDREDIRQRTVFAAV